MGNCFSDPSKPKAGQGQRLGSGPSSPAQGGSGHQAAANKKRPATSNVPPQALGGEGSGSSSDDPRSAALAAAEARAQAAGNKGVSTANPKAGQLSAKLAAERRPLSPTSPTAQKPNERMMDAGQWN
ncbi:hypothetical protein Q8F55_001327 [Vanrija albida]|uniref:SMP domain-containing protein n=1 Tax=Vanrija albida TaxID=181172 RepID=A0ABR3QGM0_9TREE